MNTLHQEACRRAGEEILNHKLDPRCYALALTEADGNSVRAAGLYAEMRSQELLEEIQLSEQKEERRFRQAGLIPSKKCASREEIDLFRPAVLLVTVFVGTTGIMAFLSSKKTGVLNQGSLPEILIIATLAAAISIVGAVILRSKVKHLGFASALTPFAAIIACLSLGSAADMVRKDTDISFDELPAEIDEVQFVSLKNH